MLLAAARLPMLLIMNVFKGPELLSLASVDCPPIAQFGLEQTLNWIFGRISHANQLADDFVRNVSMQTSQDPKKGRPTLGTTLQDGSANTMKRRLNDDLEGMARMREEAADLPSDADAEFQRRQRFSTITSVGEELAPVRSQRSYRPPIHSSDSQVPRLSSMNPPPAPNRQLPSPPGRSFPSPTSLNFPSPSAQTLATNSHAINLPTPMNLNHTVDNYLPPITTPQPSDSALREHAAALQHEVSLQKIALSSLQGEHDKLLSAFSRSQTRASTLEKKHAVSDSEIISLTEEKLRLQTQVIELEQDIEELTRSRDNYRQSAVQEGAQYVEIVNKASRLEEMRAEETKSWDRMKMELERKIELLSAESRKNSSIGATESAEVGHTVRAAEMIDVDPPALPVDSMGYSKMEPVGEPQRDASAPQTSEESNESAEALRVEIRHLRERCAQAENALRVIREDSRSMEQLLRAIQDRADATVID
jgi:hypothetical protein